MAEYKGLTVEFRGDATSLSAALATIQRDASAAQSQLTGIDKALKNSSTNGRSLNEALKNNRLSALGRDAQAATERLESLRKATPQLEANLKKASDKFKAMGTQEEYVANVTKKNSAAIAENNKQIEVTQRRMEGLKKGGRAYKSAAEDVEKLQVANKQLNDEIKASPTHWNNMRQNVHDAQRALDKHNSSLLTAESAAKAANAEFGSATRIASAASNRLVTFGDTLMRSGAGLQAVGKSISNIGDKLSFMSVVAGATFGRAVIGGAEDFGNKMAQVGVYLDTNAQGLSEMKSLALETGKETIFSAGEAAHAISELAKGGLTEAEIKAGALHATMSLAAAGQMNFAEAADTTVRAMRAFGLGAESSEEVADALAGVAARSTAEVTDLSQGFVQVAAMAHNAGWSIQETSAAIGVMADHGFSGAMAGTALKVMLQRLTAPTDKAKGLMEELGIEVRDSSGHMKSASDVIKQLNDAFYTFDENGNRVSKYSDEVRDAALSTLFGTRGINAALSLMEGGSEVFDQYAAAASRSGSAAEMAQGQLGELGWSFELLRGEAETAAVNIGERLTPTIKGIADAAEDALEWFDDLDEGSQSIISHIGLIAIAAGPLMSVGGRVLTGVGKLGSGIGGFAKMLGQLDESLETAPTKLDALGDALAALHGISFSGAGGGLEKATALVSGLKGLAVGLAGMVVLGGVVSFITDIAKKNMEAASAADRHKAATEGLISAANGANAVFKDEAGSISKHVTTLDEARESLKKYEDSTRDVASAISKHNDDTQKQIKTLDDAYAAIEKYNGKQDLTTEQYGEFASAVRILNDALGDNMEITDGVVTKTDEEGNSAAIATEKIKDLVEAKKAQARIDSIIASEQEIEGQKASQAETVAKASKAIFDAREQVRKFDKELRDAGFTMDDVLKNPQMVLDGMKLKNYGADIIDPLQDIIDARKLLDSAMEDSHALDKAQRDLDYQVAALEKFRDANQRASMSVGELAATNSQFMGFMKGAGKSISDFGTAIDQSGISVDKWNGFIQQFGEDGMQHIVEAFDGSADSIKNGIAAITGELSAGTDSWQSSMQEFASKAGMSAEQFVTFFSEGIKSGKISAGASAEDLYNYVQGIIADLGANPKVKGSGEEIASAFAQGIADGSIHAGMSVDEMVDIINGKLSKMDGKKAKVDIEGNVTDGKAKAAALDTQKVFSDFKPTSVSANVTGNAADGSAAQSVGTTNGNMKAMRGNSVDASVTGNGSDFSAANSVGDTNIAMASMNSKSVEASVTGNVLAGIAGTIWDVVNAIANLRDKTVNVGVNFTGGGGGGFGGGGGGGGFKTGGIRWHANGGIVNAPHHGYPLDMVGEAGAEAIVPLTNRRYAQPFIDMIGDNLVTKLGVSAGSVTNIYFNGNRINDNPQIREVTKDYMIQLKRLGAM